MITFHCLLNKDFSSAPDDALWHQDKAARLYDDATEHLRALYAMYGKNLTDEERNLFAVVYKVDVHVPSKKPTDVTTCESEPPRARHSGATNEGTGLMLCNDDTRNQ
ncbi:unnamed protein product [Gongylonema pulchrum]|uniref:ACB domain-containing protein n=1 Tax=Gongylonema pulchrum TaxID=637853 RepID=A0A183CXI8_9BILA|nr:unnamed protein product [Gongylonema pulchrum]